MSRIIIQNATTGKELVWRRVKNIRDAEKNREPTKAEKDAIKALERFFLCTGDAPDDNREDDLDKYVTKIVRDILQLDQISAELQRRRDGKICAFWAVDAATIETALPESERTTGVKYVQVINSIPYAYFGRDDLILDCMNPRTDVEKSGYGYSAVEQAIDLVTASINTFMYNAGFFQENKLPRGILLLNGDADTEEIEEIEDYIANLMSWPPSSQWRVPIIPSGKEKNAASGGRRFEWVNLQGTNKEMEFQSWYDLQLSGLVAMFGLSMEDLGLHTQKSQPLIGVDASPKIETSKSLVLGDMLVFLQKHLNKILQYKAPEYEFEFVGYERDDPKLTLDIDKSEVETYKSIDEKRAEKGLKPFGEKWSQVPLSPQVTQMVMGEQGGGSPFGGDTGDDFGQEDAGEEPGESEDPGEVPEGEAVQGVDGWDALEEQNGAVEKSLGGRRVVRIAV